MKGRDSRHQTLLGPLDGNKPLELLLFMACIAGAPRSPPHQGSGPQRARRWTPVTQQLVHVPNNLSNVAIIPQCKLIPNELPAAVMQNKPCALPYKIAPRSKWEDSIIHGTGGAEDDSQGPDSQAGGYFGLDAQ